VLIVRVEVLECKDRDIEQLLVLIRGVCTSISIPNIQDLQEIVQERQWEESTEDLWIYNWGSNSYSSKKAYKEIVGSHQASPLLSWMWSAGNLGKHKFFF
jgi:hypothetical protein